jgi:hypothetical protein
MPRFVVEILDADEIPIGSPIPADSVTINERLDETGDITARIPATHARAISLVDAGKRIRVRILDDALENESATFLGLIRKRGTELTAAGPMRTIGGPGIMAELADSICGWWAMFDDVDTETVALTYFVESNTGWSLGDVDAGLGNVSGTFNEDTRLTAIQKIRQRKGKHIRYGSTLRTLDFGSFGVSSGLRLTNVHHLLVDQESNTSIRILTALTLEEDLNEIVNHITGWGAGEDNGFIRTKVTLQDVPEDDATRAPNIKVRKGLIGAETTTIAGSNVVTLKVTSSAGFGPGQQLFIGDKTDYSEPRLTNIYVVSVSDGTTIVVNRDDETGTIWPPGAGEDVIAWPEYYIRNDASYADEPREDLKIASHIDVMGRDEPTDAQWEAAAKDLYDWLFSYMNQRREAQRTYRITVPSVPSSLHVGDTVRLVYSGIVIIEGVGVQWADIDEEDMYILSISRTYNANGSSSVGLEVSNLDRVMQQDALLVTGLLSDTGSIKVRH